MKKVIALLAAFAVAVVPAASFAAYGGSASSIGSSLVKDSCPGGDFSRSYYDNDCGTNPNDTTTQESSQGVTLDGYVYFDTNRNDTFDADENGVQGAVVTLKSSAGSVMDTDVTNVNGYYSFLNVMPGTYRVHVSVPATTTFTQELLAFFAPSVSAASDYEFTVVVGEEDTGVKTVGYTPVVDGEVTAEETMDDNNTMEDNNDDSSSILDIIREANEDNGAMPTSSSSSNNNGGFVLPTSLPNTGAAL